METFFSASAAASLAVVELPAAGSRRGFSAARPAIHDCAAATGWKARSPNIAISLRAAGKRAATDAWGATVFVNRAGRTGSDFFFGAATLWPARIELSTLDVFALAAALPPAPEARMSCKRASSKPPSSPASKGLQHALTIHFGPHLICSSLPFGSPWVCALHLGLSSRLNRRNEREKDRKRQLRTQEPLSYNHKPAALLCGAEPHLLRLQGGLLHLLRLRFSRPFLRCPRAAPSLKCFSGVQRTVNQCVRRGLECVDTNPPRNSTRRAERELRLSAGSCAENQGLPNAKR